jgi:HD-GYP domain-containing protein (c-di-GMP phosphodiesterase class II)
VADAFQAMTAERPYRSAMSRADALRELRANAGTQFNPVVVEAFIATAESAAKAPNGHLADQTQLLFQLATEAVRSRAS